MTEYLQYAKTIADDLIMLNVPFDNEDFILKILGGLDGDYKDLRNALRVRETLVTFDELHEQLINHEAYPRYEAQRKSQLSMMPASANPTFKLHKSP